MKITSFKGGYAFLSNFYPAPVLFSGLVYPTVEHAYQAAKTRDPQERALIALAPTPGKAKRLGRRATLRSDWEQSKLGVMRLLLMRKFRDENLADRLRMTGDAELIEGNDWGDTYWGVYEGKGHNHLGKLLMLVRDYLQSEDEEYVLSRKRK